MTTANERKQLETCTYTAMLTALSPLPPMRLGVATATSRSPATRMDWMPTNDG